MSKVIQFCRSAVCLLKGHAWSDKGLPVLPFCLRCYALKPKETK